MTSDLILLANGMSSTFEASDNLFANTIGLLGGRDGFLAKDKLRLEGTAAKFVFGRMYEKEELCEKFGFFSSSVFDISELVSSTLSSSSLLLDFASADP